MYKLKKTHLYFQEQFIYIFSVYCTFKNFKQKKKRREQVFDF